MIDRRAMTLLGTAVVLVGCGGPRAAGPSAELNGESSPISQAHPIARGVDGTKLPPAGRVALCYVRAARSWTPATYNSHHRDQVRLSTGAQRAALERAVPDNEQINAYRADGARMESTVTATQAVLQAPTQSRYRIVLDERSVAAGETVRARATYVVDLRRVAGRWLVVAFTVEP